MLLIVTSLLAAAAPNLADGFPPPMPDPGPRHASTGDCPTAQSVPSPEWQQESRRRLAMATRFPPIAVAEGMSGMVTLEMRVDRAGAVSAIRVAGTSTYPVLDQAALEAGQALTGLPPLPCAPEKGLYVRIPVRFVQQD